MANGATPANAATMTISQKSPDLRELETRDSRIVHLSALELLVVRYVHNHLGTSPRALGQAARMKSSNVAATLRSLEQKEMIRRTPDPTDTRSVTLPHRTGGIEH